MAELGVNIDHVATLRQARKTTYPDPVAAAVLAELGGAHQITVHLREDRRHIQDRDVQLLRETISTRMNLEMAGTMEMVKIALTHKPDSVTLVPERREELTTEGGLEVALQKEQIRKSVHMLKDNDIRVVLFIDPDLDQVKAAHWVGADGIEIHTGTFCNACELRGAKERTGQAQEFQRILDAVRMANKLGLDIAAGHGLHYQNILPFVGIREIQEYNIGHSIVARAVYVGLQEAVREMVRIIQPCVP